MTWYDASEVKSLRESAIRLRGEAVRVGKYPTLAAEAERLRRDADRCDLRADEIERTLT